jgi:DNA-binding winged helix-turn-helix (wHTH) protein
MARLTFTPFSIDRRSWSLLRDGVPVSLSPKLVQVLACLAEARGELVTRELLLERFWPDVIVTDNTLTRAVADIRKALGDEADTPRFIQTQARRGYRFVSAVTDEAPVTAVMAGDATPVGDALRGLEPFVAWERGRAMLESMRATGLPQAVEAFTRAVTGAPHYAAAYAGLANAHIFRYEATRIDDGPDNEALTTAVAAALRATALDPSLGEGWGALGHARASEGRYDDARAALGQALSMEPRNWRHHYRLALATWGESRLRAVEKADALLPGFPGTQLQAAMVFVARQAFGFAADVALRGATAQEAQSGRSNYPATGLLWIRGLTAYGAGDHATACDLFAAEAAYARKLDSVYARESRVVACESLGFALLADAHYDAARDVFASALEASPDRARARLGFGLAGATGAPMASLSDVVTSVSARLEAGGKPVEQALVLAAAAAWSGEPSMALQHADRLLAMTPDDSSGWSLPADPMFAPLRRADGYARLAARLAARAA